MRRLLLALLLVLGLVSPARAVTAFVQDARTDNNPGATTVAVTITTTAGNCIAFAVHIISTAGITVSSVTSSGNSPAITRQASDASARGLATGKIPNLAGGSTTVTANLSASGRAILDVHEVSGCATTQDEGDNTNSQTTPGTGTDAVTSGTVVTTVNGDYIFGASISTALSGAISSGTGFSEGPNTGGNSVQSEYMVQSVAGTVAATFTNGTNTAHITQVVAIKATSAVSSAPRRRMISQ